MERAQIQVGQELTITTKYGMLPGTHRGRVHSIRSHMGYAWYELSVFVPCWFQDVLVAFRPEQVVPDNTPTTDLSVATQQQFMATYNAAMADHDAWEPRDA
jgi:hypothetical protein